MNSSTSALDRPAEDQDPIVELLTTYNELNPSFITELDELPSALEFMRYVAQNRPFVVRGAARDWEAVRRWDVDYLKEVLKGEKVNVAVTPYGNADSPTSNEEGEVVFVKPWEEEQDFAECVDFIAAQEKSRAPDSPFPKEIRYCQTQNDNLRAEYSPLFTHVSPSPSFARIALQKAPEAVNLWIGNSFSTTALHKDNYENLYFQIIGGKEFVLLPPLAYPLVKETPLKPAHYTRSPTDGALSLAMEEGSDLVPFATWDPDLSPNSLSNHKEESGNKYENLIKPMRVKLEKGDMLYLPTLWQYNDRFQFGEMKKGAAPIHRFSCDDMNTLTKRTRYHKVSQTCSEEGICCAVNYWYDMEFSGSFYPLCNFVRSVTLAQHSKNDENELR